MHITSSRRLKILDLECTMSCLLSSEQEVLHDSSVAFYSFFILSTEDIEMPFPRHIL